MSDNGFRDMWLRERSQRFAALTATIAILVSIVPVLLSIGPPDLGTALPLVVYAVFLTFLGARYSYRLCWVVIFAVTLPILFTQGEASWDAVRNALFVSVGGLALAWAHRQQRLRLQHRARIRRKLVGRVKSRARELQQTGSELRLAVERSETAHRTLLEHLPVHVLQKDLDGRFVFVSQSFGKLLGKNVDDILGKTDYDFYDVVIADKFRKDDLRVVRDGLIVDDVERTQQTDGKLAFMQVRKAPLRDARGTIIGVQGIFWDVTETLSGRMQLQRIESWAHALIQAALDAVLIVDIDGRVLEVNPAVATILGYEQQGGEHPPLGDIMRPSANDVATSDAGPVPLRDADEDLPAGDPVLLNRLLKRATGRRIEVRLKRPDDSWFDAEISAHPLVVENSSGWAIFIRDITRRKKSVAELQSAKEAAERANMAKSEFVANVSHELRTPLTGIVGLHELLERSSLDDQQREYLTLARTSSDNLLSLIDALLDFSKIEAHRLQLEHDAFHLVECVESAAISLAARAQLRGLELVIDCDPDLPYEVIGDGGRVRQILVNLIGNAIKFTERGDIRVRVGYDLGHPDRMDSNNVGWIRFDVIDAGIGIATDTQALIFEAFRQADSSTTRRYGGTGLGLAICKELVQLMGGTISVSSVPQHGSTFTFRVPMTVSQQSAERSAHSAVLSPPTTLHMALVAGACLWRETLKRDLEALGHQVTCMEASQLLAREPKHLFVAGNHTLVVADYRELLQHEPQSLPVVARVVLTVPMAFARPSQKPDWLKHTDVRWLQRPISRAELRRALGDDEPASIGNSISPDGLVPSTRSADILLVEDSPINQAVLQGILVQLGHSVTLARNGAEAVQRSADHQFDVVLMDIQMPDVDGLEATRRIRTQEAASGREPTHVFALTAHAMPSDREQARAAGMNGFLVKPIPMESLRRALAEIPSLNTGEKATGGTDRALGMAAMSGILTELNQVDAPRWRAIDELMGGNSQLSREIVELLSIEARRLWKELEQNIQLRQTREVRRAAHTLKSNLRNVSLTQTAELFGNCETAAIKEQWDTILTMQTGMSQSIDALIHWCTRMLATKSI